MLEKLRDNPRAVVAALVAAGVLAVAVGASNQNPNSSSDSTSTPAAEVSKEDQPPAENNDQEEPNEEAAQLDSDQATSDALSTPPSGPVSVTNDQGALKATVRKGDNQTVIVRQMIADYLRAHNETLSAEQKLYVETTIVTKLPKDDTIFAGELITVSESAIADTVVLAKNLDQAAIARWSKYL